MSVPERLRRFTIDVLLLFAVVIGTNGCNDLLDRYRLRTYNQVRAELAKIPGITVVDAGGYFDDGYLLEDIYAELEVIGKGRLHLRGLTLSSFSKGGKFAVDRVGSWTPAVNRLHVARRGDTLGFGGGGEAHVLMPPAAESVADLVERYDELLTTVEKWPEHPLVAQASDSVGTILYSRKRFGSDPPMILTKHRP